MVARDVLNALKIGTSRSRELFRTAGMAVTRGDDTQEKYCSKDLPVLNPRNSKLYKVIL